MHFRNLYHHFDLIDIMHTYKTPQYWYLIWMNIQWLIWFDIYSYEYPPKTNLNLCGCFYRILAQQDMRKETHTNIQIYKQAYVLRDE